VRAEPNAAPAPLESPMRDDPSVVALVARAAGSDEGAWHELVDRYAPSACRATAELSRQCAQGYSPE